MNKERKTEETQTRQRKVSMNVMKVRRNGSSYRSEKRRHRTRTRIYLKEFLLQVCSLYVLCILVLNFKSLVSNYYFFSFCFHFHFSFLVSCILIAKSLRVQIQRSSWSNFSFPLRFNHSSSITIFLSFSSLFLFLN